MWYVASGLAILQKLSFLLNLSMTSILLIKTFLFSENLSIALNPVDHFLIFLFFFFKLTGHEVSFSIV